MNAATIAALERLASDPSAAPGEARNARAAAAKLRRKRGGESSAPSSGPSRLGDFEVWTGEPPVHGPRCVQGFSGCIDCQRIERFRAWLRGRSD